ncbi:MAG: ECF transporter S component [Oscillospiraceae bacterium]|jgi:uncharacterized membrane protein
MLYSRNKLIKLVMGALFAALTCVATIVIVIPSPTGGYVNPGDSMVLLGAFLLGPTWGAISAGLGSALADAILGYVVYAPGTLVIKGAMALLSGFLLRKMGGSKPAVAAFLASLAGAVLMVLGYFVYSAVFLGYGWGALADIPGNCVQGIFGSVAGSALFLALSKMPYIRELTK